MSSFLRTGSASKSLSTLIVVPFARATLVPTTHSPFRLNDNDVPTGAVDAVEVTRDRLAVPHKEERASPRNPRVETEARSANEDNFEVWCLRAAAHGRCQPHLTRYHDSDDAQHIPMPGQSSLSIPLPLSWTSIDSTPCSLNLTSARHQKSELAHKLHVDCS